MFGGGDGGVCEAEWRKRGCGGVFVVGDGSCVGSICFLQ